SIPIRAREPKGQERCTPGRISAVWLRDAVKLHLGTALSSGRWTWSTIMQRAEQLTRFATWLETQSGQSGSIQVFDHPAEFRRWTSDPANHPRLVGSTPSARAVNNDIRPVIDLIRFVLDHRDECIQRIGTGSPIDELTELHSAIWRRQLVHERGTRPVIKD